MIEHLRLRLLVIAVIVSAGYSYAQLPRDLYGGLGALRGEQGDPAELPPRDWPDRNVAGCHMFYSSVRREANGSGWRTDYPWAQRNLLIRLSELTKTRVSWLEAGVPHVWLVRLTDPALFQCAYLMASDVGTIGLSQDEADALGLYLKKGGFLWVDDFWGEEAWDQWSRELAKSLPADGIHDRRRAAQRSDLPLDARGEEGSTSDRYRLLAFRRRANHIRARRGNGGAALTCDSRRARPHHRRDDA